MEYENFLQTKTRIAPSVGIEIDRNQLPAASKDFQRDLIAWSARKGRAAIFADTGLGKTLMQLAWANTVANRALILAPLGVAKQTVKEGEKWGIKVTYASEANQSPSTGITITNYERLHNFDLSKFDAVVLDESSILKNFAGKTRNALIEQCAKIPYRLCCTATPAPNDITEIANHAEFLGVMSRVEMLASFFVHDDKGWRLKRHAIEPFYRWLASWGMSIKKPSDLGYSDNGYNLPELKIIPHFVQCDYKPEGFLFPVKIKGISERGALRKATLQQRIMKALEIFESAPDEQWLMWCGLNDESDTLAKAITQAVNVQGSDSIEYKEANLLGFASGEVKVLVTKPKVAGLGMNFQSCAKMIFVGLGDSYEQYYQTIRRCWRFGQTRPVEAHIVLSEGEHVIYDNVLRKEREAEKTANELIKHIQEYELAEIKQVNKSQSYQPKIKMVLPPFIRRNNENSQSISY